MVEVEPDIGSAGSNLVIPSQAQRALSHVIKALPRLARGAAGIPGTADSDSQYRQSTG